MASPRLPQNLIVALVARAGAEAINKQQTHAPHDTALSIAIRARNEEFARALLAPRIEINLSLCNTEGNSPLHVAAAAIANPCLPQDLIVALVARANEEAINKQQAHAPCDTALIIAIRCNNTGFVKRLLTHPNIKPNVPDATGKTPLIIAIEMGRQECFDALLAHTSIDPNFPDITSKTPLIVAIELGRQGCIGALLDHPRIERNTSDRDGNTPAHYAVVAGSPPALRSALLTHPCVEYNIQDAARVDDHDRSPGLPLATQLAILSRSDPRRQNRNHNNPIHIAAQIAGIDPTLVQALVKAAGGWEAIHTFNTRGLLACDASRNASDAVKRSITPYPLTLCYLRSQHYFSTHPDSQDPATVEFAAAAAPQHVEQPAQAAAEAGAQEAAPQHVEQHGQPTAAAAQAVRETGKPTFRQAAEVVGEGVGGLLGGKFATTLADNFVPPRPPAK
jgi:ankyrin repeat protein